MMSLSNVSGSMGTGAKALAEFHARETASTFAGDIGRRIAGKPALLETPEATGSVEYRNSVATEDRKLAELESSIANSVQYIAQEYGDEAGTAAMAIMYKSFSAGGEEAAITEERLGEAFLDVTRFIDKNFGTEKGDAFLKHLNVTVNEAMNEYFDNGVDEAFFSTDTMLPDMLAKQEGGTGIYMEVEHADNQINAVLELIEEQRASENQMEGPYAAALQNIPAETGLMKDITV